MMPLVGAETIYGLLSAYRYAWFSGRFSVGKTSLAFLLARHYLEKGYRLITNTKTPWADSLGAVRLLPGGYLRAVLLFDEGGLWLSSNKFVKQIAAYAAKMDLIFLIPSFFPPAPWFRILRIHGLWTLRHVGIPLTVYRWSVSSGSYSDTGTFLWVAPRSDRIYGVYSRQDPGDEPYEIVNWMQERLNDFRAFHGRAPTVPSVPDDADTQGVEDAWARIADGIAGRLGHRRGLW